MSFQTATFYIFAAILVFAALRVVVKAHEVDQSAWTRVDLLDEVLPLADADDLTGTRGG